MNTIKLVCSNLSSKSLLNGQRCSFLPINITFAGIKTRSLESRLGIPEKPKKPLTPFFRFMREMRPKTMAAQPNAKCTEIVKILSSQWPSFSDEQKKKWQAEYKKDKEVYIIERAKYESKLTGDQRLEIKQLQDEIADNQERIRKRRQYREHGRPKRPPTAYLIYLSEQRVVDKQKPNETYREWHTRVSDKWRKLSDKEKETYFTKSKESFVKYQKDLTNWEIQMVKSGNPELIRADPGFGKPGSSPQNVASTKSKI